MQISRCDPTQLLNGLKELNIQTRKLYDCGQEQRGSFLQPFLHLSGLTSLRLRDKPSRPEIRIALLEDQRNAKKLAALKTLDLDCYQFSEIEARLCDFQSLRIFRAAATQFTELISSSTLQIIEVAIRFSERSVRSPALQFGELPSLQMLQITLNFNRCPKDFQMKNVCLLGKLDVKPRTAWLHVRQTLRLENESKWSNSKSDLFPGLSSLISKSLKGENPLIFLQLAHRPLSSKYSKSYTYNRMNHQG